MHGDILFLGRIIMLFVSRGYGVLVLVFYFGALLCAQQVIDSICGKDFYSEHIWPKKLAFGIGAVLCWFVGRRLNSGTPKILEDVHTRDRYHFSPPRHDFFFIRIEY
jgi:hypothetical protein